MAERTPCEFFLIRYVPEAVKGEFVNIGVLLREADAGAAARTQIRFTRDWGRVRCIHADADTAMLESLEGELSNRLAQGVNPQDPKSVLEVLEDSFSNLLQVTEARGTLAENMAAEMDQLLRLYVEPVKAAALKRKSGRAAIHAAMRHEFERAGVWSLMRKRIAASGYTQAGDTLRIDCGYRAGVQAATPDGLIRMFQAVSLEGDAEAAKVLAFSTPQMADGVRRLEDARLELTAVVEPLKSVTDDVESEAGERYRFGVETMERQRIRVMTMHDVARAALTAQRELGL